MKRAADRLLFRDASIVQAVRQPEFISPHNNGPSVA
jgi:hypothetical protein